MNQLNISELQIRIDEVLYYIWDPIGVNYDPCARHEYTSYVPAVLGQLLQHDDVNKISLFLATTIRNSMELCPNTEKCNYTAEILLKYKDAIKENLR